MTGGTAEVTKLDGICALMLDNGCKTELTKLDAGCNTDETALTAGEIAWLLVGSDAALRRESLFTETVADRGPV